MARNKEFDIAERLGKAKDLFWEKGYNATSMHDLVDTMKLNPGSIYGTFGGKHQLFMESLKMYCAQSLVHYENAATKAKSPLDAIKAIIQKAIERAFTEDKACLLVKSSFELAKSDAEAHALLKQESAALISMLEKLIRLAQAADEINPNKDAKTMATFIVVSFAGFWQMQLLFNDETMVRNMSKLLLDSFR
ncbi:TetR/AcrR family transcriptional regulator [Pedobacter sp. HCMS5-2]|uniref:TetR/AcrR family transcriptional regulator n=2 Tax=Pedobacter punctiformis TaxID=3004097 RepID=A0ABT4L861_9SPHI|nr:TetR/AcrR family transcriptional regulator [Pedobacter sp. HCMS5-2]